MWNAVLLSMAMTSVLGAHQASVYKFPQSSHAENHAPSLSPAESRQIFSEVFKVSRFHKLGFIGQQSRVLESMRLGDADVDDESALWSDSPSSVVLNIAGVTEPTHIFPDARPLYHIADSPPSDAYSDLLIRLLGQAQELRSERLEKVYGNARGGGLYLSPPVKVVSTISTHGPSLDRFTQFYGQDIAKHFDIRTPEDRSFIAELSALESFIDALSRVSQPLKSQFAVGHLVGLETLYYKYGAHSSQYTAGVKAMHTTLSSLYERLLDFQDSQLHVALLPPVQRSSKSSILKRWEENEAAFGDIHAAPVLEGYTQPATDGLAHISKKSSTKPGLGGCYDSQKACEADTDSCSGHGSCHKYLDQESCYKCMCSPTVKNSTAGKKTTVWAGSTCAKKDVSFEFQIFFWFTVMMVATLWWATKMLYSVEIGTGGVLAATGYINNKPTGSS